MARAGSERGAVAPRERALGPSLALLLLAGLLAALAPPGAAAHGGMEEAELFASLAEEPGFLRLAASLFGALVGLLGAGVLWQGLRTRKEMPPGRRAAAELLAPGAAMAVLGLAILGGALLLLPDKIERHRHGAPAAAPVSAARPPR